MYQISLGIANTSEMKVISSLLIKPISFYFFLLYIMGEVIKEAYESNFGSAYETYKDAIRIVVVDFKM